MNEPKEANMNQSTPLLWGELGANQTKNSLKFNSRHFSKTFERSPLSFSKKKFLFQIFDEKKTSMNGTSSSAAFMGVKWNPLD